ncbi:MAG: site-specific integrase [Bacteroidetes bacterium]|nr:site-specific integrase [Bacteroidota bacterium]
MGVYLREKKIGNNQVSFYLDIYHNKTRWYEFLEIRINKTKLNADDKEKKRLAQEIRSKREHELIVQDNGLTDKRKKLASFIDFFENFISQKKHNSRNTSALYRLKLFAGKEPLPFIKITTLWMKDFERYLLKHVTVNSALNYLLTVNSALNEAVRRKIIPSNPWHDVPKGERLKKQDIFRTAYSLEDLQKLVNTPFKYNEQIKQAFLMSCFSGLRWSDVNQLRWDEIIVKSINGEKEYFIYFEQEKTEKIEYLPMSDQAIEIIEERRRKAKKDDEHSDYVFPFIRESSPQSIRCWQKVRYALKKWAALAKLDSTKMHFHASRHSFACNILENSPDADIYTVSKLLGHKSVVTTQIYAQVRDQKKAAAVKSLPSLNLKLVHIKKAS